MLKVFILPGETGDTFIPYPADSSSTLLVGSGDCDTLPADSSSTLLVGSRGCESKTRGSDTLFIMKMSPPVLEEFTKQEKINTRNLGGHYRDVSKMLKTVISDSPDVSSEIACFCCGVLPSSYFS